MSNSNTNDPKEDMMFKMYYQSLLDGKKPTRSRVSTKNDPNNSNNNNEFSLDFNSPLNKENESKSEPKDSNLNKKRKVLKKKNNKNSSKSKKKIKLNKKFSKSKSKTKRSLAEENSDSINLKRISTNENNYPNNNNDKQNFNCNSKNKKDKVKIKGNKKENLISSCVSKFNDNDIHTLNNSSNFFSQSSKNNLDNFEVIVDNPNSNYSSNEDSIDKENDNYLNNGQENVDNYFISSDVIKIYPSYPSDKASEDILPLKLEKKLVYNLALPREKYLNRYIVFIKNSTPIFGKIIRIHYEERFSIDIYEGRNENDCSNHNSKHQAASGFEVLILNKEIENSILNLLSSFGKSEDFCLQDIMEKFYELSSDSLKIDLFDLDFFEISNIYVIEQVFLNRKDKNSISNIESFDDLYENLFAVVSKIIDKDSDLNNNQAENYFPQIEFELENKDNTISNSFSYLGFFMSRFNAASKDNNVNSLSGLNDHDYTDYSMEKYLELREEKELDLLNYSYLASAFNNFHKNFPNNSRIPKFFSSEDKMIQDLIGFTNNILNAGFYFSPCDKKNFNNIFLSLLLNDEYLVFLKNVEFSDTNLNLSDMEKEAKIIKNNNFYQKENQLISNFDTERLKTFPAYLSEYNFYKNPEKFVFHEALIKTSSSENYCLILNYNKKSESIYVRYFRNGMCKWLCLNKSKNEKNFDSLNNSNNIVEEIHINKLKGAADKNSYYREILNCLSNNNNNNKFILNNPNHLINLLQSHNVLGAQNACEKKIKNINNFDFYKKLKFFIDYYCQQKINKDSFNSNYLILKKKTEDNFNLLKNLECSKCTYQIIDVDYRFCRFCRIIYHACCLPANEKGFEAENDVFGKTNFYWTCKNCKHCIICVTENQLASNSVRNNYSALLIPFHAKSDNTNNSNPNSNWFVLNINPKSTNKSLLSRKLICKVCFNAFHYECLPAYLKKIYPSMNLDEYNNPISENFKCESCIKCISCNRTNSDLPRGVTWSKDFEFCSDCKRRYEKKEFCPLCKKLWSPNETKMVQCKCKFWVHSDCDRVLTEENLKKLTEKKSQNYHCPFCRIKKKNKILDTFIDNCISLDRNGWFFFPVDTVKEVNYLKIVKNPISFSLVKTKAFQGIYLENPDELVSDLKLIFTNAKNYNFPNTKVHKEAYYLMEQCVKLFEQNNSVIYQNALEYYLFDRNTPIDCAKGASNNTNNKNNNFNEINIEETNHITCFMDKVFNLLKSAGFINGKTSNLFLDTVNAAALSGKNDYLNYLFPNQPNSKSDLVYYFNNHEAYLKLNEKKIAEVFNNKYPLILSNAIQAKIHEYKLKWAFLTSLQEKLLVSLNNNNANYNISENESRNNEKNNNVNKQYYEYSLENINNNNNSNYENHMDEMVHGNQKEDSLEEINKRTFDITLDVENNKLDKYDEKKTGEIDIENKSPKNFELELEEKENQISDANLDQSKSNSDFEVDRNENNENEYDNEDKNLEKQIILNNLEESEEDEEENILELNENEKPEETNKAENLESDEEADQIQNNNILEAENIQETNENIVNLDENPEALDEINNEEKQEVKQKSSLRQQGKNKLLGKNNDFQHELDIYNSNFDVAVNKKNQKINKNVINKIEFNENNYDNENNTNEDQEDNEERLLNLFNYHKEKDFKTSFLYMNKAKKMLNYDEKAYLEHLELMDYILVCKDENRRKKALQSNANNTQNEKRDLKGGNRKASPSPDSVNNLNENQDGEYEANFIDKKKAPGKAKKGRPRVNRGIENDNGYFNEPKNLFESRTGFVNNTNSKLFANSDCSLIKNGIQNNLLLGHKNKKPLDNRQTSMQNFINQNKTNINKIPGHAIARSNSNLIPNVSANKFQSGLNLAGVQNNVISQSLNVPLSQNYNNNNTEHSVSNFSNNNPNNVNNQLDRNSLLCKKGNLSLSAFDQRMQSECGFYQDEIIQSKNNSNNMFPALVYLPNLDLVFEPSCYLCGSFDDKNLMLNCSCCRENFHSYCISNSDNITNNVEIIKKYMWKCSKCKICEKCEINNNEISLLYCDSCDRAYHISCLDVPLNVVPESGWKCLNCFKCQNCETHVYYKNSFKLSEKKDYSIFTRNFNYCFDCGMKLFCQSLCAKCEISHFRYISKNLVFLKNRSDYEKKKDLINENSIIMLRCNLCHSWFHSKCKGFDEKDICFYFESYQEFSCLDCYLSDKYKERFMEVTFVKYLEVLKMSYIVMCFSKLIMIILRSISKDSNIKLHSKLLKAYLKENYHLLLKDKNICMLLELIRMDIFILKDKDAAMKKKNLDNLTKNIAVNTEAPNIPCNLNEKESNVKASELNNDLDNSTKKEEVIIKEETENLHFKYSPPEVLSFDEHLKINELLNKINQEKTAEKANAVNLNENLIDSIAKKIESERNSKIFLKLKRKNLFVFDIKNSKNNYKTNKFLCNSLNPTNEITSIVEGIINQEKYYGLDLNEEEIINVKTDDINNINNNYNVNEKIEKEMEEKKRDYINHNYNEKNFKRKYRLRLRAEKMLNNDIKQFFGASNDVKTNGIMNMDNLVKFYEFNLDEYYNSKDSNAKGKKLLFDKTQSNLVNGNHISTNIFAVENANGHINDTLISYANSESKEKVKSETSNANNNSFNNNNNSNHPAANYDSFINKVLEKLRMYLKLEKFPNKIRKFILNLILRCILILKTSLIKWLITQILSNSESSTNFISKNNLLLEWVNISDKYFFEHHIINSENTQDLSDEEITKFLDYIDPLEDSVTKSLLSCEFCGRFGARKQSGRLIHIKNEIWGHVNCIIKSRGVFETAEGNLINVSQILNKIKSFKCFLCRKLGATVICEFKKCGKSYHFACALAKQSVFTKSGKFFCLKCSNSKEEPVTNFETKRRFVVVKNSEFINDARVNYIVDYNFDKILPKYFVGSIVKFGNTSILKFFNLNKKELAAENYDINVIKLIDGFAKEELKTYLNENQGDKLKEEKEIKEHNNDNKMDLEEKKIKEENENLEEKDSNAIEKGESYDPDNLNGKKFLLLQINENGMCLSEFENLTQKEIDLLFNKYKLLHNFEKTDFILNTESQNFVEESNTKSIKQAINVQTEKIITLNPSKDNFDSLMKNTINKFNEKLELYVDRRILSEYEKNIALKINRSFDWMSFFNIFLPFNLLLKNFSQYSKAVLDYSESLNNQLQSNECLEIKLNRRDNKSKLDFFCNLIKTKNINENECFRQIDYINNHRELKLAKKSAFDLEEFPVRAPDRRNNKFNKQSYKNLERTMSTNIMDTDLPLAMKFRNYKALKTKVTIGPSTIHRNGLFALQGFQPGEIVIEYVGELIRNKIADFREMEYNFKGFGDCYMFRLDKDQIIDATKYGNLARFINHCCDPNCSAQVNSILDKKHIILYAKKAIKPNEEITYDYNFECEEEKIQCRCGAKNCLGRLN